MIPKKLQVVTEKEILEQVAKELNIPFKDVNNVFNAWLYHLEDIIENTDQCTVYLPHVGRFYASMTKMKRGMNTERLKKFKKRKTEEIDRLGFECERNPHRWNIPVILAHGISKLNYIPYLAKGQKDCDFYSPSDVVNNQTEHFFREDIEFAGNNKLKQQFLRKTKNDFEFYKETSDDIESEVE